MPVKKIDTNSVKNFSLPKKSCFYDSIKSKKIFIKDINLNYVWCNKTFANFLGLKIGDIVGKTSADLFSGKMVNNFKTDENKLLSGKIRTLNYLLKINNLNNKHKVVYISKIIIKINNKKYILGVVDDITVCLEIQAKQQEYEQKLNNLVNLLPEIIFEIDVNGNIIYANEIFYSKLQLNKNKKYNLFKLLANNKELIVKIKKSQQKITSKITYFFSKKDSVLFLLISLSPIFNKDKKIIFWQGVMFDISQELVNKLELEEKIRELERVNELMVNRELKMIELKQEIKKLKQKLKQK